MSIQSRTFADLVTFTRASTATRFNSSGLQVTAAINEARIDYDPANSNAARGLLIEGQRTNLLTYSQDLTNAAWSKLNATVALNQADLTGTANTASRVSSSTGGGSGQVRVSQSVTISGTNAVVWAVLRAGTITQVRLSASGFTTNPTASFDLSGGTVISGSDATAKIRSLGSGRYLCWFLIPVGADPAGTLLINMLSGGNTTISPLDGSHNFDILASGVESGNFPTTYIPTTTSQVTRSKDEAVVSGTDFSEWYNASEGTFYIEFTMRDGARPDRRILSVNDGTDNDRMTVAENSSSQLIVTIRDGGVDQASLNAHTITNYPDVHKLAFAFKANDFAACVNGGSVATDTSGTVPTVDRLHIASDSTGSNQGQCHIRKIRFFPTRKTNAELQALTA